MHSSRMHTVCCNGHLEGGCLPLGPRGLYTPQADTPQADNPPGRHLPPWTQRQIPPVDRQTPVKTLPFRNYCCKRQLQCKVYISAWKIVIPPKMIHLQGKREMWLTDLSTTPRCLCTRTDYYVKKLNGW